jgi:hypothetical protein
LPYKPFENTLGKRRNYFLQAISPYPTVFFNPFEGLSAIFIKFKTVICKLFQFGSIQNLSLGKGLSHSVINTIFSSAPFLLLFLPMRLSIELKLNT